MNRLISMVLVICIMWCSGTATADTTVLEDTITDNEKSFEKIFDCMSENADIINMKGVIESTLVQDKSSIINQIVLNLRHSGFVNKETILYDCVYVKQEPVTELKIWNPDYSFTKNDTYSATTVCAEIVGTTKASERVVLIGNINSMSAGLLLDTAIRMKIMIDDGKIDRPERTITFIFGDEYTSSLMWRDLHPQEMLEVKGVIDIQEKHTSEDTIIAIEKTPEPSVYMKAHDSNETAALAPRYNYYQGFYLNTLCRLFADIAEDRTPDLIYKLSNWQGGGDSDIFTWHTLNFFDEKDKDYIPEYFPIPSVTIYYNTNDDSEIDSYELEGVKSASLIASSVACAIADITENEILAIIKSVEDEADKKFEEEKINGVQRFKFSYELIKDKPESSRNVYINEMLESEIKILRLWKLWYCEAIRSCGFYLGDSMKSDEYINTEREALTHIEELFEDAVNNALVIRGQYN